MILLLIPTDLRTTLHRPASLSSQLSRCARSTRRSRLGTWAWGVAIALSAAQPARAESPSDSLFRQGKALMDEGNIPEACQKFAESLSLQRRGGTLLNLAVCREKEFRFGVAYRLFEEAREVAQTDGHPERATLAGEHMEKLKPRLSWLTVRLAAPAAPAQFTIQADGEDLPPARWGTAIAMDPGSHSIVAQSPGRTRFSTIVEIGPAGTLQLVEIPDLPKEPAQPEGSAPQAPQAPTAPQPTTAPKAKLPVGHPAQNHGPGALEGTVPSRPAPAKPTPWLQVSGGIALGLGVAALATGAVFGAKAIRESDESKALCGPNNMCPSNDGYSLNQNAWRDSTVANITIPIGIVAAGAGIFLLLRPGKSHSATAQAHGPGPRLAASAGPNLAGIAVQGSW